MGLDPEFELALHHLELNKLRGLDFNSNLHIELEPGYPMIVIWSSLGGDKPRLMTCRGALRPIKTAVCPLIEGAMEKIRHWTEV